MKIRLNVIMWLIMVSLVTVPALGQEDPAPADQEMFTILGNVGAGDVRMRGLPGNVISDSQGNYSATVNKVWTGIVLPSKEGYKFEPRARRYKNIDSSLVSQDYAAEVTKFQISGHVGVPNVAIKGFQGQVLSDTRGRYVATVSYAWSGTITPKKDGMKFVPASISFSNVTENMGNQDFNVMMPLPVRPSPNLEVLVVPTTEVMPNQFASIQQDMRVMLHILKKTVQDEKHQLVGGVFSQYGNLLTRNDQSLQSLYIQGYGALFFVQASIPLEWSSEPALAVGSEDKEKQSADPVWQQARNQVFNPSSQANQPRSLRRDTEALMRKLIDALKHAANIRYMAPEEHIVVTVLSGSDDPVMFGMSAGRGGGTPGGFYGARYSRTSGSPRAGGMDMYGGGGMRGGGDYGEDGMDSYEVPGVGGRASFRVSSSQSMSQDSSKSTMTFQASKAQVDAYAQGQMKLDEFLKNVQVIRY